MPSHNWIPNFFVSKGGRWKGRHQGKKWKTLLCTLSSTLKLFFVRKTDKYQVWVPCVCFTVSSLWQCCKLGYERRNVPARHDSRGKSTELPQRCRKQLPFSPPPDQDTQGWGHGRKPLETACKEGHLGQGGWFVEGRTVHCLASVVRPSPLCWSVQDSKGKGTNVYFFNVPVE